MDIRQNEFKKAITSPIIIGLLGLFIVFNSIIIFENSYIKDELKILNKIVYKCGYKIDNEMKVNFKNYYNGQLKELNKITNKITNKKTSKSYKSVKELYEKNNCYIDDIYNKKEMKFIKELGIVESYFYAVEDIDKVYSKFDIMEISEREIKKYGLRGKAADTVRNEYKGFNKRYERLIENKEHKNLFFLGKAYGMHSLLFKTLFKTIIFEIIILVVFITSYLMNYEFDNKTETIAYSTKRGRNLAKDKLYASMSTNMLIATLILITGLGLYFIIFDYSRLWNVPISSYFNSEKNYIYMSWWNISFVQYLFLGIALIYAITLIFTGIVFLIARSIRNNYIVFSIFAIMFGLALIPSIAPTNSNTIFIKGFTPFFLIENPFIWFMEGGAFTTFKYYELFTVGIWSILLLILSILSIKRFKTQDI